MSFLSSLLSSVFFKKQQVPVSAIGDIPRYITIPSISYEDIEFTPFYHNNNPSKSRIMTGLEKNIHYYFFTIFKIITQFINELQTSESDNPNEHTFYLCDLLDYLKRLPDNGFYYNEFIHVFKLDERIQHYEYSNLFTISIEFNIIELDTENKKTLYEGQICIGFGSAYIGYEYGINYKKLMYELDGMCENDYKKNWDMIQFYKKKWWKRFVKEKVLFKFE